MQTNKPVSAPFATPAKKHPTAAQPAALRSAPVALDAQALRQVAGGNTTNGPHKTW